MQINKFKFSKTQSLKLPKLNTTFTLSHLNHPYLFLEKRGLQTGFKELTYSIYNCFTHHLLYPSLYLYLPAS